MAASSRIIYPSEVAPATLAALIGIPAEHSPFPAEGLTYTQDPVTGEFEVSYDHDVPELALRADQVVKGKMNFETDTLEVEGDSAHTIFITAFSGASVRPIGEKFPQAGMTKFTLDKSGKFTATYENDRIGKAKHTETKYFAMNGATVKVSKVVSGTFDFAQRQVTFEKKSLSGSRFVFSADLSQVSRDESSSAFQAKGGERYLVSTHGGQVQSLAVAAIAGTTVTWKA